MMWGWGDGHWGAGGWIGMAFMILLWIAIIVGVIYLIRYLTSRPNSHGQQQMPPPEQMPYPPSHPPERTASDALSILEERYARDDIEREDFLKRKADLTS